MSIEQPHAWLLSLLIAIAPFTTTYAPTGGSAVWSQDFAATPVVNDDFNVILGNNVGAAFNDPSSY